MSAMSAHRTQGYFDVMLYLIFCGYLFFRLLAPATGFRLNPRSRDCLPQGFPENIEGTCHFLDGYIFPYLEQKDSNPDTDHIALAVKHYKIKEQM